MEIGYCVYSYDIYGVTKDIIWVFIVANKAVRKVDRCLNLFLACYIGATSLIISVRVLFDGRLIDIFYVFFGVKIWISGFS